ncbi:MAG TPA: carbohydrate porin [Sphingomicrobium sp.]|nr:carbohydrate porin [Sphingomicrobium sp.]
MIKRTSLNPLTGGALLAATFLAPNAARAQLASGQNWAIHAQTTFLLQANARFRSDFQGTNSLDHRSRAKETFDLTGYLGVRPWGNAEIWVNPEIDQGFGLSNTVGAAGFPSGEAYKVGKTNPYAKLPRWFLRQTVNLGGEQEKVDSSINQLAGRQSAKRLVFTVGKFGVVDVFDTNDQAHDPRSDFLNWTIIDAGTFDYAANAWGYTYGGAAELYEGPWTFRGGIFALSKVPNSEKLDPTFKQNEIVGEIEHRHTLYGRSGKLKITVFRNRGRMGRFEDAIRLAQRTGERADMTVVRRKLSRPGVSFSLEQQFSNNASIFVKGGTADGSIEPFEFTDVDKSLAAGLTLKGSGWDRVDDSIGVAVVMNRISGVHTRFLDAGGLGLLVGDGRLPNSDAEQILEAYYDFGIGRSLHVTLDGQIVNNPAYNRDRGPVPIGAIRIHAQL